MSASVKCGACQKTAYPLESIVANDKSYHKGCFKCAVCKMTLNVKNFKLSDGQLYCAVHTPKATATAVADSVAIKNALNAPKKSFEGLGTAQKGSGDRPNVGLDSLATKNAMNAPKKIAEGARGVQKGTGGTPQTVYFGGDEGHQSSAPAEGYEQQQYEEAPQEQQYEQYEEQQQYEQYDENQQQYDENQQYEEQQYEEEQ
ncbi:LIM-type zinc finger-containing protein [Cavenderia fasciculata]|uniref:LIM-type zinc finger-containing protein n=1 Tax=Cavenderia fasciculata TaxID=261658 RepID=F4Q264_CACFS|nr:LIM-type zinc finger-containing protein [Cavenderia fasciculata]EGG18084.1 LIM-type zinc finger-containing protein [Cavenderia fasciculata]|eukprot:XP_004366125.1 LIM-type zinc finger-containing protein [Cavenderia fasciculata]